jgi:hypothetical protein
MERVQKPSNSVYYTPSSEPFIIYATLVFTGAQYQTSYLPNIPPYSKKGEGGGVWVNPNGKEFGICGREKQSAAQ